MPEPITGHVCYTVDIIGPCCAGIPHDNHIHDCPIPGTHLTQYGNILCCDHYRAYLRRVN